MNLEAKSFTVFAPPDHQRYVRDLAYRLLRDEEKMHKQFTGEVAFHIVVYSDAEFKALAK